MTTKAFPQLRKRSILKPSGKDSPPEIRRTHKAWLRIQNRPPLRSPNSRKTIPAVDLRWIRSFDAFLDDVGPCPEDHRPLCPDPESPCGPGNFVWAQISGPRRPGRVARVFELNGEARTLHDWAQHMGVNEITLRSRLDRGVPFDLAITPTDYRRTVPQGTAPSGPLTTSAGNQKKA